MKRLILQDIYEVSKSGKKGGVSASPRSAVPDIDKSEARSALGIQR